MDFTGKQWVICKWNLSRISQEKKEWSIIYKISAGFHEKKWILVYPWIFISTLIISSSMDRIFPQVQEQTTVHLLMEFPTGFHVNKPGIFFRVWQAKQLIIWVWDFFRDSTSKQLDTNRHGFVRKQTVSYLSMEFPSESMMLPERRTRFKKATLLRCGICFAQWDRVKKGNRKNKIKRQNECPT